jgi:hypothetical protein
MNAPTNILIGLLLCGPLVALQPGREFLLAKADPATASKAEAAEPRDGQRDFDFSIGTWRTRLSRLQQPLSGSNVSVEYEGTSVVRAVLDGRANLVELDVEGPAGRIVGLSLRLYDPESGQWSLNYANGGIMSPPVFGEFRNGRGEFFGQEMFNGRAIFVKFVMSKVTPDTWRYEQSFSDDGGKTWEVNWIALDTLEDRED